MRQHVIVDSKQLLTVCGEEQIKVSSKDYEQLSNRVLAFLPHVCNLSPQPVSCKFWLARLSWSGPLIWLPCKLTQLTWIQMPLLQTFQLSHWIMWLQPHCTTVPCNTVYIWYHESSSAVRPNLCSAAELYFLVSRLVIYVLTDWLRLRLHCLWNSEFWTVPSQEAGLCATRHFFLLFVHLSIFILPNKRHSAPTTKLPC
jgi:hypothetical protein